MTAATELGPAGSALSLSGPELDLGADTLKLVLGLTLGGG